MLNKKRYLSKFDEIEIITSELLIEDELDEEKITSTVLDVLIDCYLFGFEEGNRELGTNREVNEDDMYDAIYFKIDGRNFEDRIRDYLKVGITAATIYEITRVIDTETHRVMNVGKMDVVKGVGKGIYKTWRTMNDLKVRDSHFYLEGTKIPVEEEFETYSGATASYPGQFGIAEEDCNCRCVVELSFK